MELTLEEAKNYLHVDSSDEDGLISSLIASSIKLCRDVARIKDDEEADHHELTMNLRSLLFSIREGVF